MCAMELHCDHRSSGGRLTQFGLFAVNSEDPQLNQESVAALTDMLQYEHYESGLAAMYAVGNFGGAREEVKTIARDLGYARTLLACEPWYDDTSWIPWSDQCFPSYIFFFGQCTDSVGTAISQLTSESIFVLGVSHGAGRRGCGGAVAGRRRGGGEEGGP